MNDFKQFTQQIATLGLPPPTDWSTVYDAVIITGPTASGKSALAMQLAMLCPTSIISVDSALVYTGMDIGTAKPSISDRNAIPHYLIDLIDPTACYSVAQFLSDTTQALIECREKGRFPLLVGGTMMYINALYKGLSSLPQIDDIYRKEIEARALLSGWAALHTELAKLDPITAARLAPTDTQRIGRALAVVNSTGVPLSQWLKQTHATTPLFSSQGVLKRYLHLSIEPEKHVLWQRIEQRFESMLARGFLDEMRILMARGDLSLDLPSMRCIGYRQAWLYLSANDFKNDLDVLSERSFIATRQLAKRQMTWLRTMTQRVVLV
jgi:tRNA dimethylallyltransferase